MDLAPLILSEKEISLIQCSRNITHIETPLGVDTSVNTAQNTTWGKESPFPWWGTLLESLCICFPNLFFFLGGWNGLKADGQSLGSKVLCLSTGGWKHWKHFPHGSAGAPRAFSEGQGDEVHPSRDDSSSPDGVTHSSTRLFFNGS